MVWYNAVFYNICRFVLSLCSGDAVITQAGVESLPGVLRGLRVPRCRLGSWSNLQIILYVQMSWTPMSLQHLFHFKHGGGGEDVMGILSVNTCGFMAFWRCPFDVAGFWLGVAGTFCHSLRIRPRIMCHRPPSRLLDWVHALNQYLFSLWHGCVDAWHFCYILWNLPEHLV